MKQKFTKILAVCLSAALCVSGTPAGAVVTAADAHPDYTLYFASGEDRATTVYVSEDELKEGDVTIPVAAYMVSEEWTDPYIDYTYIVWESSDWNAVRFGNPLQYTKTGSNATYTYSGGTFTSRLTPHMLAAVTERRGNYTYASADCVYYATETVVDPIFGETLFYDGKGGVYFEASYFTSLENKENKISETKTFQPEVIDNGDGTATFKYEYVRQDNYETDISTGTIPFYEPDTAADTAVPGKCDLMLWQYSGEGTTKFLGASDEFPAVTFDAIVQQGTPAGTYTVNFSEERTYVNEEEWVPASTSGLTIVVTGDTPVTTTTTTTSSSTTSATTTAATTTSSEPDVTDSTTTTTTATTNSTAKATTTTTAKGASTTTKVSTTTVSTAATTTTKAGELTGAPGAAYLSDTTASLYAGMQMQLSVYNAEYEFYDWVVSDESVATISENGLITAVSEGTCRISTVIRGKMLVCNVTVTDGLCGDVNLSNDVSLVDAVLLGKYLANLVSLNGVSLHNADCYDDDTVTSMDVKPLMEYLAEITDDLPQIPS